MSNALLYWKAIELSNLFTDADEEQLHSHAGWKLVENLKSHNPLIKWILSYTPATLITSLSSFYPTHRKTALIVGGVSFLFTTFAIQYCQNYNVKNFNQCINIFSKNDAIFKQFILDLQEKEVAFFSVGKSSHAKVCSRQARIMCLKYLRKYAELCIAFSIFLKSEMDYPITLCYEMLPDNPKLIALAEINTPIRDEHIMMDALRNMYHFVFICRSEMFHLFMVDSIYRNNYERDEMLIKKLMEIADGIEYQGFVRALNYQPSQINHALNYIRRLQSVPAQRRVACIVQLEALLEQLNSFQSLPSDCSDLIQEINNISNILTAHHREELAKSFARDPLKPDNPPFDAEFSHIDQTAVFEAIPGTRDTEQREERDSGGGGGKETFSDDDDNSLGSISPRKNVFVLDELRTKLQPRKEMALQKEREATARFRKVPIEEVSIEDVLEDMKHTKKSITPHQNEWLDKPFIGKSVNMGPTTSLISQIVQRRKTTETAVIGDTSDSE
uniref:Uncharacterized protein n=1 Tax=Panagrolaimus sp. ES5 TaxID=591445 RepID=A0AC34F7D3_9BILA